MVDENLTSWVQPHARWGQLGARSKRLHAQQNRPGLGDQLVRGALSLLKSLIQALEGPSPI
jgi:hypothetical protein